MKNLEVIYGENTYLIEKEVKNIKKNFGEIIQGINYVAIEQNSLENIIPELQTPAFGYPKKLIVVKNCDLLKKELKTKKTKNMEVAQKIAEYIEENHQELQETTILLIIEESIDKTNSLYKMIEKYGETKEFKELNIVELSQTLKSICSAYKVNIDNETIKYLIETSGTSMQELINEIRKLIEYAGTNGTIDKKAVNLLAIPKIEAVIFDLTDSLGSKQIGKALETLRNLIYNKEPIQKILITLYNHFKKLYLVKLAQKENTNITEVLNLKPNQTFLTTKYKKQSGYFEEKKLREILEELINLDTQSKSGQIELNIGLEAVLCNYI